MRVWASKRFSEVPRKSCAVASRKISDGIGTRRERASPAVLDAVLAAEEVRHVQRRVGERAHMKVLGIELAESALEPAHLEDEIPGDREEREVSLLDPDAPLLAPERDEEVRARVRIDDGLQADLRLPELEARLVVDFVVAGDSERVADHGDVRVEDVARLRGWTRSARPPGPREREETEEKKFCEKEQGRGRATASIFLQRNLPPKT